MKNPDELESNEDKNEQSENLPIIDEPVLSSEERQHQSEELEAAKRAEENASSEIAELKKGLETGEQPQETSGHDKHEHGHVETQMDKDKMAKGILDRIEELGDNIPDRIKERAKGFAERVKEDGFSSIGGIEIDFYSLAKNPKDEVGGGNYDDWHKQDVEILYRTLYGQDIDENAARRRINGEKMRQQQEELKKSQEEAKRHEEEAKKVEQERIQQQKLEEQRKSRWFGLGRFFGGGE
jgi:hypothetical protein